MKRVVLLRHGKSDWDAPFANDRERPLAGRGRRAAKLMGRFLSAAGWAPDRVLTSPALRATATVELAAEGGAWSCPVEPDEVLYSGEPADILERLHTVPTGTTTLLLTGHQPIWSQLLALLAGGGNYRLPTASVAALTFDVETWQDLAPGTGELRFIVPPKLFQDVPLGE